MGNSKLIKRLRERFDLSDNFTDEEVLSITDNTLLRASIELNMVAEDLKKEFTMTISEAIKNISKALRR